MATVAQLIRRVADNDIKLHGEDLFKGFCVNELIRVGFQFRAPCVILLVRATKPTASVSPCVLNAREANIAVWVFEILANGVSAVGCLGAVHRTAGQQGGQVGVGDTEELILENMVQPFLSVWYLPFQPFV